MVRDRCVPKSALLGENIIENVPTSYIKHALVVYVTTVSINFMDTVVT